MKIVFCTECKRTFEAYEGKISTCSCGASSATRTSDIDVKTDGPSILLLLDDMVLLAALDNMPCKIDCVVCVKHAVNL